MKIFYLDVVICWLAMSNKVLTLVFDGPCPAIATLDNEPPFSCAAVIGQDFKLFHIFGHLPASPKLISIFHNNSDLGCTSVRLKCDATDDSHLSIQYSCHSKLNRYGYNWYDDCDKVIYGKYCPAIALDTSTTSTESNQIKNFSSTASGGVCSAEVTNFKIYTLNRDKYIVVYGCMDLPDSNQHEESAWIWVRVRVLTKLTDAFYEAFVDTVLEQLSGVSATKSDFVTVDFRAGE